MGTYVWTCRKPTIVVDGIRIGMFSFAYRYDSWDGWVPESFNSNAQVKRLEARARKARAAVMTNYFIPVKSLTKKHLYEVSARGNRRIEVYQAPYHEFQHVEHFADSKPVGWLYFDADQKIRFAGGEHFRAKTSCTA